MPRRSKNSGDWISCDGGKTITAVTTKLPPNPFGIIVEGSYDGVTWFIMSKDEPVRYYRFSGINTYQPPTKKGVINMKKKAVKKPAKKGEKKSC